MLFAHYDGDGNIYAFTNITLPAASVEIDEETRDAITAEPARHKAVGGKIVKLPPPADGDGTGPAFPGKGVGRP